MNLEELIIVLGRVDLSISELHYMASYYPEILLNRIKKDGTLPERMMFRFSLYLRASVPSLRKKLS